MEAQKTRLVKSSHKIDCAQTQTQATITLADLTAAQELIQRRLISLEAEFKRFLALVAEYTAQRNTTQ